MLSLQLSNAAMDHACELLLSELLLLRAASLLVAVSAS
jgi:hypothetical protein